MPSEAMMLSREEVVHGLLSVHSRLNSSTEKLLEASAFVYSLIEVLIDKGVVSLEEIDERKRAAGERLAKQYNRNGMGVLLQEPEFDKYAFAGETEIDCENRIALCKASCCRLPFALSKQDIREGIVEWDLGRPYMIAQGAGGYCKHLQGPECRCAVRENRPVPCRAYDCRNDKRIWLDFERREINPEILEENWPYCLSERPAEQPKEEVA